MTKYKSRKCRVQNKLNDPRKRHLAVSCSDCRESTVTRKSLEAPVEKAGNPQQSKDNNYTGLLFTKCVSKKRVEHSL